MTPLLARLEDFRLLPVFVLVSMAIGIAIGNAPSIPDFTLTPPINELTAARLEDVEGRAIKAVPHLRDLREMSTTW